MIVTWTVEHELDFYDDYIDEIVNDLQEKGRWDEKYARKRIREEIEGYDDYDYYAWGTEQTEEVLNVIKQRFGGEQLRMELD